MTTRTDELMREFVIASHWDLSKVKALLAQHPDLLDVEYDWGAQGGLENGLAAAAHVGSREIAEFFLAQGAAPTLYAWVMLGEAEKVKALLTADPSLAGTTGAHGISILFHAALSGNVELIQWLYDHGCTEDFNHALHGAVAFNHKALVVWLLENGVTDATTTDYQNKTPLETASEAGFTEIAGLITDWNHQPEA